MKQIVLGLVSIAVIFILVFIAKDNSRSNAIKADHSSDWNYSSHGLQLPFPNDKKPTAVKVEKEKDSEIGQENSHMLHHPDAARTRVLKSDEALHRFFTLTREKVVLSSTDKIEIQNLANDKEYLKNTLEELSTFHNSDPLLDFQMRRMLQIDLIAHAFNKGDASTIEFLKQKIGELLRQELSEIPIALLPTVRQEREELKQILQKEYEV